jgi:hypothetical protein
MLEADPRDRLLHGQLAAGRIHPGQRAAARAAARPTPDQPLVYDGRIDNPEGRQQLRVARSR